MKNIHLILLTVLLYTLSISAQNNYLGLRHLKVSDLIIQNGNIYASTSDGIFKKNISSLDTIWIPVGMQGTKVIQTLILDTVSFISITQDIITKNVNVVKTSVGDSSFSVLLKGDKEYRSVFQNVLAYGNNTIYSVVHNMKTIDGGSTWTPIVGIYGSRFIKIHPDKENMFFAGGSNLIYEAWLKYSTDTCNSFISADMKSYFSGDNDIYDIEFAENKWICTGQGLIASSEDNGVSWKQVWNNRERSSNFSLYTYDIEKSENGIIYASGTHAKNHLGLLVSSTNGQTWDTITISSDISYNPGITCIAINSGDKFENIYLGGNGVYLYSNIISGITDPLPSKPKIKIHPNPSKNGVFNITFENADNEMLIKCSVFDLFGRKTDTNLYNQNQVSLTEKGIYLLRLETNQGVYFEKVVYR